MIISSSRAEEGLLRPIEKELKERKDVEVEWFSFRPDMYNFACKRVSEIKPDILLVPCVPKGTYVHTNSAIKEISEIRVGNQVLSHDGYYHKVSKIYRRYYEGKIFYIKPRLFLPLFITPEHPIYAIKLGSNPVGYHRYRIKNFPQYLQPRWIAAQHLKKGDLMAFSISKKIKDLMDIKVSNLVKNHKNAKPINSNIQISSELLRCLGLYVAEGSKRKSGIRFSFNPKKEKEYADFVLRIIPKYFGIQGFWYIRTRSLVCEFNSRNLRRIFEKWFGSYAWTKKLPNWIMYLPAKKTIPLLKGLFEGDGWKIKKKNIYKYSTTSKILAIQIMQLFHKLEIFPSLCETKNSAKAYGNRKRYEISVAGQYALKLSKFFDDKFIKVLNHKITPRQSAFIYKGCIWTSIDKIKTFPFEGEVFNLAVADSNSYVCNFSVVHNCDRDEIVYVAAHAFHENIIVAHFHSGNVGSGVSDEMNRRAISCFSHILLCNSPEDKKNLVKLGEEEFRCYIIGSTAFNHVEIDESLCPDEPYDLVLLHPDPISEEQTYKDLAETLAKVGLQQNNIIWLKPNKDRNSYIIEHFLFELSNLKNTPKWHHPIFKRKNISIFDNLPRPQFLGLLKNCSRAIGNSSSFIYEVPFLNKKAEIIMIGKRNTERQKLKKLTVGGSRAIAQTLATIKIDDKLRRKKLVIH